MAARIIARCALCGESERQRKDESFLAYTLLADACRKEGVKLKARNSNHFHTRCAVRALTKIKKFWIGS